LNLGIEGKKALITGASRGIGKAIAESLQKEGVILALVARNSEQLKEFVDKFGHAHKIFQYNLTEEKAPKQLVDEMLIEFGYPDILIQNLGGPLDIKDPFCGIEEWRKIYRLNLEVAIELNLLIVPNMQKNKWGRVVHISSIASLENQGTVPYCSIKAALNAYVRSFGRVVSSDGVNISAVLPGSIFAEGGYWDIASRERPEFVKKYLDERIAMKRFGEVYEVSDFVAFLCSQQASFVAGSSFLIDGGQGKCVIQQYE
jgi:3-oxoacyl-[acyl-carrier protein] reductase